jgi:hypothetical protein
MLVTFRTAGVPHERRKRRGKTDCMHGCPDTRPSRHPGARKPIILKFTITVRW